MSSPPEQYNQQLPCAGNAHDHAQPHHSSTAVLPSSINQLVIELNNESITEFEAGNLTHAIEILSRAAMLAKSPLASQVPLLPLHLQDVYRYHWVDCSSTYRAHTSNNKEQEGAVSFLCLRALKVSAAVAQEVVDSSSPCEWIWVLWYNLALMYAILGIFYGERGHKLLDQSNKLFQWVQMRIDHEKKDMAFCKGWSLLQMAVLNNQACVCREMAQIDATATSLSRLAITLETAMGCDGKDVNQFLLNLLILCGQTTAGAA